MRISVLWSSLASYSLAFFKELVINQGCTLQLIYQSVESEAPYKKFNLSFCDSIFEDSLEVKKNLYNLVLKFSPDCVLMSSWAFPHFMWLTRYLRTKGVYVVSVMDNQWIGSPKQWLGICTSRWFLKPSIDTFFVAGDRQAHFARRLGYDDVLIGCYAADIEQFSSEKPVSDREPNFLFIGRLVPDKGVSLLIEAYRKYYSQLESPWGLLVAGTGEMDKELMGIPGCKRLGFIQPTEIPHLMQKARCLVLPSLKEPWGVVIQEAAAAGLPIIATYSCGASVAFLKDGINGYLIAPRVENLTKAMCRLSMCREQDLQKMSQESVVLARLWDPKKQAKYFCERVKACIKAKY